MIRQFPLIIGIFALMIDSEARSVEPDQLRASELKQQQLLLQTRNVGQQMDEVIYEFERNGLGQGKDVEVLKQIRSILERISVQDMQKVIEYLQAARIADHPDRAADSLRQAHESQQVILAELRTLLVKYQRQQDLQTLATLLTKLAERQNSLMNSTVQAYFRNQGKSYDRWEQTQKTSFQLTKADQDTLNDDAAGVFSFLKERADSLHAEDDRVRQAIQMIKDQNLSGRMKQVSEAMQEGRIVTAASEQRLVRESLYALADLLMPPGSKRELLERAQTQLQHVLEQQKQQARTTSQMNGDTLRQDASFKQAELVDQTDRLRRKLSEIVPQSSENLSRAQRAMNESRSHMSRGDKDKASLQQQEAVRNIEAAIEALQEHLASVDEKSEASENRLTRTQEMLDQTRQLRQDQRETRQQSDPDLQTAARQQQALAERARQLQEQAALNKSQSLESLAEAAKQAGMASEKMLSSLDPASSQELQKAAENALKQAEEKLREELAQLEMIQEDLADARSTREQINELMNRQSELVQRAIEQSLRLSEPRTEDSSTEKVQSSLDQEQSSLAVDARKSADQLSSSSPEAHQSLNQAAEKMRQAAQQLQQDGTQQAISSQKQAMSQLQNAAQALDQRIGQLQESLGRSPELSLAEANQAVMESLAEAQQSISLAKQQVQQGHIQPAAEQLIQAAGALMESSQQHSSVLPFDAESTMQEASMSLRQAAAETRAARPTDAQESLRQAQEALSKAQASLTETAELPQNRPDLAHMPSDQSAMNHVSQSDPNNPIDPKETPGDRAASGDTGPLGSRGRSAYIGLPPRDRQAIIQSRNEEYPQEFAPEIERYLRQLSDQSQSR